MKICVLIKQVASEDSPIMLNDNQSGINLDSLNLVTNEPDSYALEEALKIKESTSGGLWFWIKKSIFIFLENFDPDRYQ